MARFTERHYDHIAATLKDARTVYDPVYGDSSVEEQGYRYAVLTLASMFESDNPAFDMPRFLRACGQ